MQPFRQVIGWRSFRDQRQTPRGASADQIPEMLQALPAERFKLEIRREMKEQRVYALLVANGGARLKPPEVKADSNSPKSLGPDGKPRPIIVISISTESGAAPCVTRIEGSPRIYREDL
jgi:uncharacterized protein (TIGR03435 family)